MRLLNQERKNLSPPHTEKTTHHYPTGQYQAEADAYHATQVKIGLENARI